MRKKNRYYILILEIRPESEGHVLSKSSGEATVLL